MKKKSIKFSFTLPNNVIFGVGCVDESNLSIYSSLEDAVDLIDWELRNPIYLDILVQKAPG